MKKTIIGIVLCLLVMSTMVMAAGVPTKKTCSKHLYTAQQNGYRYLCSGKPVPMQNHGFVLIDGCPCYVLFQAKNRNVR